MIKDLVQKMTIKVQIRTYRCVHDINWPTISEFCLPQSVLVNLEKPPR